MKTKHDSQIYYYEVGCFTSLVNEIYLNLYKFKALYQNLEITRMEQYLKDDDNQQLMRLPEQTIREIFRYLSFETLYFYLRNVCKKMKCYVDHFIDVGGIFFLEGHRRGRIQHSEVIYIIQTKNEQFEIFWRPVSFVPWSPVYFKNDKGEEHRCY